MKSSFLKVSQARTRLEKQRLPILNFWVAFSVDVVVVFIVDTYLVNI